MKNIKVKSVSNTLKGVIGYDGKRWFIKRWIKGDELIMHHSESDYLSDADLATVKLPDLSNQNVLILSTSVGTNANYFAKMVKKV